MRHLFLLRHAKSSWTDHTLSDFERPLNDRGKRDAPVMAKRLSLSSLKPSFIVCSPSKRTTETLDFFLSSLNLDLKNVRFEKGVYEASLQDLISISESLPETDECVLIIGHNPGLSLLVEYYTGNELDMPTCAFALISFQIDSWSELSRNTGLLISFEYPKKEV